jgi:MoaA/NifB/PqqE/SkfB family radical SAM enzyme
MAKIQYAHVNGQKEIVLPDSLVKQLGIEPGDGLRIDLNGHGLHLRPSIHAIRRVYIEVTNKCNLNCSTCMRNVWDVQYGHMTEETFDRILSGLGRFGETPELFFGGYGEPLSHPNILSMIERAKQQGHHVSLITNGILLTETVASRLIDLHLDMIWVSLDGASSECYSDVRLGDALPTVIENLVHLRSLKYQRCGYSLWSGYPKLGIAFVAMRRNIHDLGEVIRLGTRLGAVEFSISNVLAHNKELLDENLYMRSLDMVAGQEIRPTVHLPLMDMQPKTLDALCDILKGMNQLELSGALINQNTDRCPFVDRGSLTVRWDGKVSPCLPLLYTHKHFLGDRERTSREYFVGDVRQKDLSDIWNDASYRELRSRLQDFDFSPCAFCNSCEMANENLEDCFGNLQPTCGGCLWARGLIRCP